MSGRSVSFGDVEEQVYEDDPGDYWGEDEVAEDYSEPVQQSNRRDKNKRSNHGFPGNESSLMCPQCGSRNIEAEPASGASVCVDCGTVVEENAIVSAIEFQEGNGGSASMVGQFVAQNASRAFGSRGIGRPGGYSSDSREATLNRGRRRIQDIASRMRLGPLFVDAAHRLFSVAVEKSFSKGRKTTHVVAACLYIACRQEKSQHMLIDFSDALQVNVYTLGTTFLKFRRLLGLKLEIIDPALYVYRFAAHLDLDEKANAVALTALRLCGRMKRDWILTGRRPAGICAAALLIAARAHGFSRHQNDVTRILRVCGLTVKTRLKEFEQAPASTLTLTQFSAVSDQLQGEMDPPRYTRNKMMEARAKAIQEGNVELLESGALDDPMLTKQRGSWRDPRRHTKLKNVRFKSLYAAIDQELSTIGGDVRKAQHIPQLEADAAQGNGNEKGKGKGGRGKAKRKGKPKDPSNYEDNDNDNNEESKGEDDGIVSKAKRKRKRKTLQNAGGDDNDKEESNNDSTGKPQSKPKGQLKDPKNYEDSEEEEEDSSHKNDNINNKEDGQEEKEIEDMPPVEGNKEGTEKAKEDDTETTKGRELVVLLPESESGKEAHQQLVVPQEWADSYPKSSSGKKLVVADHATEEERMEPTAPVEAKLSMSEWKEDMPDEITDEIESMFRSEEEMAKKEVIFNKINKEYIEQQERKKKEQLEAEAAKDFDEDDAGQAEAHRRYMKRGRKKKRDAAGNEDLTTEEALLAAVNNRKISRRINYDAMSSIFDDDGAFANDTANVEAEGGMEFGEL